MDEADIITESIIANLNGETTQIPYFTYLGGYLSREGVPKGFSGIYIFVANEDIPLTRDKIRTYNNATNWDGTHVGASFNNEDIKKIYKGDIFYIGKSSGKKSSIFQRLKIHFGDRTNSATNGIKMKMPERRFIDGKLTVHVFIFEKTCSKRYLIDYVEKKLHELLRPLTGGSQ